MSTYLEAPNKLVTCPYDECHRVKASRLQMHVAKCKLNHLDKDFQVCPFNATHHISAAEKQYHVMNCPDRWPIDKKLGGNVDKNNFYKGRTAVPSYTPQVVPTSETWDDEINPNGVAGYVPNSAIPKDGLVLDLGLTKPSERKKIYKELHHMPERETQSDSTNSRTAAMQSSASKSTKNPAMSMGAGRGAPRTDRIAANIFGAKGVTRQPKTYQQIVESMNSLNLGIGRGRGITASKSQFEEDFPALGNSSVHK